MHNALIHRALGAQLLQAQLHTPAGLPVDLFYLSPLLLANAPARGGVPVLFPQFADTGPLPKHGMVRNAAWQADGDSAYTLHIAATDHPAWPHACALRLGMQATANALATTLTMTLTVRNTGTTAFSWTGGLHPYFAVADTTQCQLLGLAALAVQDRYNPAATHQTDSALVFTSAPCERLYAAAPPLQLVLGSHCVQLQTTGFTEWMVWNPGTAGAQTLADLPDDDWKRFVCIEPVCVNQPVVLAPGEVFEGGLRVRVV
jgi:glucose-6-phosphate 1-epimerase